MEVTICQRFMQYNSQWIIISTSEQWNLVHHTNEIPIHNEEHDCGGFCCMYADCISNDCHLNFSSENIEQKSDLLKRQ